MQSKKKEMPTSLYVYIPCHTDFPEAITQANFITNEINELKQTKPNFKICISYNGDSAEKYRLLSESQQDIQFVFNPPLGGDINISLGLLNGVNVDYKYIWILSVNDRLKKGCIEQILNAIQLSNSPSMITFGDQSKTFQLNQKDILLMESPYRLGLISSVIYERESFQDFFGFGIKYQYTGWGQLAVLLGYVSKFNQINTLEIPSSSVYELIQEPNYKLEDYLNNFVKYFHSFYGLPMTIDLIVEEKIANKYWSKWFLKHYKYFIFYNYVENRVDARGKLNHRLFKSILRERNFFLFLLYKLLFENFFVNHLTKLIMRLILKKMPND